MDGKIARLKGTGSVFGAWLDYVFDPNSASGPKVAEISEYEDSITG